MKIWFEELKAEYEQDKAEEKFYESQRDMYDGYSEYTSDNQYCGACQESPCMCSDPH